MLSDDAHEWIAAAVALAAEPCLAVDEQDVVLAANEAARRLVGEARARDGRPLWEWLTLATLNGRPVTAADLAAAPGPVDALLDTATESGALVRVTRRAIQRHGRACGALLTVTDVGSRAAAERRAQHENEETDRAQAREAVGIFMAGVGNELRNGLQTISGHAEMIADDLVSPKARRISATAIRRQCQRVLALVSRMLDFSHAQEHAPVEVDLADAVIEAFPGLRAGLPESIELVSALRVDSCRVRLEPGGVPTALGILVDNARHAMPAGGTITVSVDRDAASGGFCVRVTDTGSGIGPDVQAHLFEPFFTTRKKEGAAGLGLSQLAALVRAAGGRVNATSEVGRGTEVAVFLPRAGAPALAPAPPVPAPPRAAPPPPPPPRAPRLSFKLPHAGRVPTVLVVDDEADVLELAQGCLASEGYRVLIADSGSAALAIVGAESIDLLLTDVFMPEMRGPALAKQVLAQRPLTRVLYMTGAPDKLPRDAPGHHGVLAKPFSLDVMREAVRAALPKPA